MDDITVPNPQITLPSDSSQKVHNDALHKGILDKTLGEVLENNPQAQQLIINSMGITSEKFQEMLNTTQQNNMMHMKISDLFKQGIMQQAVQQNGQQLTPEQAEVVQQQGINSQHGQVVQSQPAQTEQKKVGFVDKLRGWFK